MLAGGGSSHLADMDQPEVELQKVWYVKQKLKLIVIPVMTKVFFYWTDAMPAKCEIISRKLNISV